MRFTTRKEKRFWIPRKKIPLNSLRTSSEKLRTRPLIAEHGYYHMQITDSGRFIGIFEKRFNFRIQKINNITDYYSVLEDKKPGETVKVKIIRGKKLVDLNLTLSERN